MGKARDARAKLLRISATEPSWKVTQLEEELGERKGEEIPLMQQFGF